MRLGDKIALLLVLLVGPLLWYLTGAWQLWVATACVGLVVGICASANAVGERYHNEARYGTVMHEAIEELNQQDDGGRHRR